MTTVINQIDYRERDVGKMNPESKREVAMHFTVNGKEYDLLMTWSFSSGKQSIFVNGIEEVFARNCGASIIDSKFEFDGHNFQLIGTRTRPKGTSYDYSCFELLINGVLLSDSPREGSAEIPKSTMGNSIIDLLYPNHPCRKRRPLPPSEPKGHMYSGVNKVKPACDLREMTSPVDPPVANATQDLLLDFNPNSSDVGNGKVALMSDFPVSTGQQPSYSNYTMFDQPQIDASNPFGVQPQIDTANTFNGLMLVPHSYATAESTSDSFGGQSSISGLVFPFPSSNDSPTLFAGAPSMLQVTNHYSFSSAPLEALPSPPPTVEPANPFAGPAPTVQPPAYNNYNYYDAQAPSTTEAANLFGGAAQPPSNPVHQSDPSNPSGYSAIVPCDSNHSYATFDTTGDQFDAPPAPLNNMHTSNTNAFGGFSDNR